MPPYDPSGMIGKFFYITRGWQQYRLANPSQNQWLQDSVWDTINTCWSHEPQQRCELSVAHYVFSMPCPQDALAEIPPVGRENLVRLAEELLCTFLVLPLDPGGLDVLRKVQEYISDVVSRDEPSQTSLSSAQVATLTRSFHKVYFRC
jgi:hypothetical protein